MVDRATATTHQLPAMSEWQGRGSAPGMPSSLDTPSSWRGGSVGVGYLHQEGDG